MNVNDSRKHQSNDGDFVFCANLSDTLVLWPDTPADSFAVVPCPTHFQGILLSPGNASRQCYANATWNGWANYSQCVVRQHKQPEDDVHSHVVRIIYYVGFSTSVVALSIALFLFLYFRCLRCLRNTIHCHLIVTFILKNLLWLKLTQAFPLLSAQENSSVHQWVCKIITTLFNYLLVTNFFWMLVEGFYLHTMIVWAFSIDRLHLLHYILIGWGIPALFVVIWAVVKATLEDRECWLPADGSKYDYIFIAPILAALLLNLLFLASIIRVLVTKLRATNSSQNCVYRKAAKATMILFPLLGVTYLLFIFPPADAERVFVYCNSVLQSTQGLLVAIFYCFINVEVQSAVKNSLSRWRDGRRLSMRGTRTTVITNASVATVGERVALQSGPDRVAPTSKLLAAVQKKDKRKKKRSTPCRNVNDDERRSVDGDLKAANGADEVNEPLRENSDNDVVKDGSWNNNRTSDELSSNSDDIIAEDLV